VKTRWLQILQSLSLLGSILSRCIFSLVYEFQIKIIALGEGNNSWITFTAEQKVERESLPN
jgi:hypothetical protein